MFIILKDKIETIDSDGIRIKCLNTLTGVTFFAIAAPQTPNLHDFLEKVYASYTQYVLKNPFHTPEMPIKSTLFIEKLMELRQEAN